MGDSNLTYILTDFTAPEGTLLNAARYRFEDYMITTYQDYRSPEFKVLDDGNPNDNKISLVMSIITNSGLVK